ncbi:hypothetical protein INR49_001837 [Caranx melampygus]|nr:hypothetical protein INR49_001837 [Caranx melampygus]
MNLGDGLLFELENGKPRLILLSHGNEKNPAKVEGRPVQQQPRRHKEARAKAGGAAPSFNSSTTGGRSTTLISSRTHEHHNGGSVKAVPKVKLDRHKHGSTVGSLRTNGKTGQPQNRGTQDGGKAGLKESPAFWDAGPKDSMAVLTNEQLQQILNTIQTSTSSQHLGEDQKTQGRGSDGTKCGTSVNQGGGGGEMNKEDRRKGDGGGGVTDSPETSPDKDNRLSGCLFSWLDERQSYSRSAIDAKKAQWKRELDEQMALKQQQQQCSVPSRLQAEEDTEKERGAEETLAGGAGPTEGGDNRTQETREAAAEPGGGPWALGHPLDSLQRRPPVHPAAPSAPSAPSAPPPAPSSGSERGDWEPSSSLSLVWEATSSCGAESVGRASVDTTSGYPSRAGYLRTMTALLDPTQIEERERRRLKQLEQQRAIEAQMEERRQQKEREKARRREEEEEEDRRVALEREKLQRQYKLDTLRERPKEQPSGQAEEPQRQQEVWQEVRQECSRRYRRRRRPVAEHVEEEVSSSVSQAPPTLPLKEDDVSAQHQPPPAPSAAPPNSRSRAVRAGKENVCVPGGGAGGGTDPYEAFARTDRSRRDKRRPEWNTQRPSRRFVPASERYPAALQRNRQESRLRRQAELLALQERTCQSRTDAPPSDTQTPRLCPTQTRISPHCKVGASLIFLFVDTGIESTFFFGSSLWRRFLEDRASLQPTTVKGGALLPLSDTEDQLHRLLPSSSSGSGVHSL